MNRSTPGLRVHHKLPDKDSVTTSIFRYRLKNQREAPGGKDGSPDSGTREANSKATSPKTSGDGLPEAPRAASYQTMHQQLGQFEGTSAGRPAQERARTIHRETPKVGRNDPCPCGSGKKYKNCHGK